MHKKQKDIKNRIGILIGFLLAGCESYTDLIEGPSPGITHPHQMTAPLPWIHVIPSERALAFKLVDFHTLDKQIHYDIKFSPHEKVLKDVRLILVDYTIHPAERAQINTTPPAATIQPANQPTSQPGDQPKKQAKNQSKNQPANQANNQSATQLMSQPTNQAMSQEKLDSRHQRYFLTMSFYECDKKPPQEPLFEATGSIRRGTIPPQEAILLMAREIIEDYHSLAKISIPVPQKKIVINFD